MESDLVKRLRNVHPASYHGDLCHEAADALSRRDAATVMVSREAWKLALSALHEAEAILGGEYGDTYAILCETMCRLEAQLAAAKGEGKP